jgi:hypothetical protein
LVVLQHVKSATDKRVKRPADAAATAAVQAASSSDELAHFDRRVEIVAHWLALSDEATSFDPSTPKLKPAEAMIYGGLGGLEGKESKKAKLKVAYVRTKLNAARVAEPAASLPSAHKHWAHGARSAAGRRLLNRDIALEVELARVFLGRCRQIRDARDASRAHLSRCAA